MAESTLTLHLTPVEVWSRQADRDEYLPETFAADGFIHCTDGEELVIEVGNRYYTTDPRPFCLISIDLDRVIARVAYEDLARVYPHIYGPVNIDAVVNVKGIKRAEDGTFLGIAE